jgi:predicted transcriptional regulator
VRRDATLHDVVYLLVSHRIYRVWVVDEAGCPIGVISNTDICDLVHRAFGIDETE